MMAALTAYHANRTPETLGAFLAAHAQAIRTQTPQQAAQYKLMAERVNVSDEEMEVFKRTFFAGQPPTVLADVFGSVDAAKIVARMILTAMTARERGQASE